MELEGEAQAVQAVQLRRWKRLLGVCALACVPLALAWLLRAQAIERRRTFVHPDAVTGLAFARDGQTLMTATVGWDIHVWDASSARERARWRSSIGSLSALAPADGGRRLVSVADNPVRLQSWEAFTGTSMGVIDDPHKGAGIATTYLIALLPLDDGRLLVCSHDIESRGRAGPPPKPLVHLWDSRDGSSWMRFPAPLDASVTCAALSSDGSRLAWGDANGIVTVWDARRKRPSSSLVATPRHRQWALVEGTSGLAFSPDASILAASGGTQVSLWNRQGHLLHLLSCGRITWRPYLCFSPDGRFIAAVEDSSAVHIWRVADGQLLQTIRPTPRQRVGAVTFSPDSTRLAVADGLTVRLHDVPLP